jgi:hypothetical protein
MLCGFFGRHLEESGTAVVSKSPTAMTNEVLCKIIRHYLASRIQEQEALGIVPIFWNDEKEAERIVNNATLAI